METTAQKKSASVYSLSFTQIVNNFAKKEKVKPLESGEIALTEKRSAFSKDVFRRRNAIAVAAILAIGILHFAFQMSFIQRENKENLRVAATVVAPPKVAERNIVIASPEFEMNKADDVKLEKSAPAFKQRRTGNAPPKLSPKKQDSADTNTERLRRAEKILTGI